MKRILLQLLLLVYAASILKPAMPLLSDALAHTFTYAEHIKTVHKEQGKYHVHYEILKQAEKSNKENDGCFKKNSLPDEHLVTATSLDFIYPSLHNNNSHFFLQEISSVCKNAVFSPPRC